MFPSEKLTGKKSAKVKSQPFCICPPQPKLNPLKSVFLLPAAVVQEACFTQMEASDAEHRIGGQRRDLPSQWIPGTPGQVSLPEQGGDGPAVGFNASVSDLSRQPVPHVGQAAPPAVSARVTIDSSWSETQVQNCLLLFLSRWFIQPAGQKLSFTFLQVCGDYFRHGAGQR